MAAPSSHPEKESAVSDEQSRPQGAARSGADGTAGRGTARRRWLKPVGIVLAVLGVLVVVPGLFAIQPSVIGSRAGLRVQHDTWLASKHGDVPCQGCHAAPTLLAQAGYDAKMLSELYLSVVPSHSATEAFARPTNAACAECHKDLITTSPSGDLIIPHRAHTDVLNIECVTCHAYLVHEESPEGKHTPPMSVCLKCHDGKQAKNACVTCHTSKAAPDTHKAADWLVVHPVASKTTDCAKCHGWVKNWCADCHERRPPSHTADWRTKHAAAVAVAKPRDCETCHTSAFCSNCHGVVPARNYDPSVTLVK